jgi:hypothetical protein
MVNYAEPQYTHGVMLTVVRRGAANERNWEGDYETPTTSTHQVGPADVKWLTDDEDNSTGEILRRRAQVTVPRGQDVLSTDGILYPGISYEFVVDGEVRTTPNAFTNWASGTRFRIAKDGRNGV